MIYKKREVSVRYLLLLVISLVLAIVVIVHDLIVVNWDWPDVEGTWYRAPILVFAVLILVGSSKAATKRKVLETIFWINFLVISYLGILDWREMSLEGNFSSIYSLVGIPLVVTELIIAIILIISFLVRNRRNMVSSFVVNGLFILPTIILWIVPSFNGRDEIRSIFEFPLIYQNYLVNNIRERNWQSKSKRNLTST